MKKEFFKFVFLGAGSSVFTMRLVGDILKEDTIKKGHIALVDLDEKLLRETEEAVKELVAFSGQEFEVTAHIDYKKRRCRERIICLIRLQQEGTSVGRVT